MWNILLSNNEASEKFSESIFITKSVRVPTENMGIRKTQIALPLAVIDITYTNLVAFFAQERPLGDISFIAS